LNAYNSETRAARAKLRPDLDSLFSCRLVTVDKLIVYDNITRCLSNKITLKNITSG